jgi:hypothetical protein
MSEYAQKQMLLQPIKASIGSIAAGVSATTWMKEIAVVTQAATSF